MSKKGDDEMPVYPHFNLLEIMSEKPLTQRTPLTLQAGDIDH
jgi:hypothetical protein